STFRLSEISLSDKATSLLDKGLRFFVRSEAANFRFRLCPPKLLQRQPGRFGRSKFRADRSGDLGHRENGFRGHVAIIWNDRGNHVDRAGAFLQKLLRLAV